MIKPSLPLAGYALAVGILLGSAGGWRVASWAYQAEKAKAEREHREALEKEHDRGNQIADDWAKAAETLRANGRRRESALRRELEKTEYRCRVPDSGGVLLDEALRQANAARGADATVPGATAAGRAEDGRPSGP